MSFLKFFPQNRARLSVFKSCSGRYPSPQWFFYMVSGTHLLPPGGYKLLLLLSWHFKASLIAQLVKNPPAMQETWVRSLGWEDPPEKGRVTQCSSLDSMDCIIHGIAKSWTQLSLSLSFNPGRTDCLTSPPFYLSGCFFLYVFSCGESFLLVFNLFS